MQARNNGFAAGAVGAARRSPMTLDQATVRASSPDGRMFRLDLGGDDGYAEGDFVTIAEDSGDRRLGLIEALDQRDGGSVTTGSMLPGRRGAGSSRPFPDGSAAHSESSDLADLALVVGSVVPAPTIIRFRDRSTDQGGIDVPVPVHGD
jgi:hypothetical protein